jgi:SlyX protein
MQEPVAMEAHLRELETRITFQEQHIAELNGVIAQQQRQLDALDEVVRRLHQQLRELAPSIAAPESEESPPPHY